MNQLILTLLVLFLSTCLVNCAKAPPSSANGEAALSAPSGCAAPQTGSYAFRQWGTLNAQVFECGTYPKMDCAYAVSDDGHSEFSCTGKSALDLNGVPDGYVVYSYMPTGSHLFDNGLTLLESTYDGGEQYGGLHCFYYKHTADVTFNQPLEEILCL